MGDWIDTKQMRVSGNGQPLMIKKSEIQAIQRDRSTGLSWVLVAGKLYPTCECYDELKKQLKEQDYDEVR